jgi:hypothetical protein
MVDDQALTSYIHVYPFIVLPACLAECLSYPHYSFNMARPPVFNVPFDPPLFACQWLEAFNRNRLIALLLPERFLIEKVIRATMPRNPLLSSKCLAVGQITCSFVQSNP